LFQAKITTIQHERASLNPAQFQDAEKARMGQVYYQGQVDIMERMRETLWDRIESLWTEHESGFLTLTSESEEMFPQELDPDTMLAMLLLQEKRLGQDSTMSKFINQHSKTSSNDPNVKVYFQQDVQPLFPQMTLTEFSWAIGVLEEFELEIPACIAERLFQVSSPIHGILCSC
jgi:hypothetical protein